ncbi:hypothetical protein EYZ11_004115 [Aspergillus tanneri]|uniref:Uncharacterized protein n=1 Tax=Aspergillus tanneri TaxID=1220188 RepID=A0A4S3JNQ7_9EURO|nr:hypothetical protein EYZ11_004115 [Aspergillus tanneri]
MSCAIGDPPAWVIQAGLKGQICDRRIVSNPRVPGYRVAESADLWLRDMVGMGEYVGWYGASG